MRKREKVCGAVAGSPQFGFTNRLAVGRVGDAAELHTREWPFIFGALTLRPDVRYKQFLEATPK